MWGWRNWNFPTVLAKMIVCYTTFAEHLAVTIKNEYFTHFNSAIPLLRIHITGMLGDKHEIWSSK